MQLQFLICFENDNFPILQFAIATIYYRTQLYINVLFRLNVN